MRGHLKTIILNMLNKEPMSGSEIIKEIEITMNWKPSCGSIYPLLKTLEKEDITHVKSDEGKKIYALTTKGKKILKEKQDEKEELVQAMEKSYYLLESLYGLDTTVERSMLEDVKRGEMPFREIYDETKQIRDELVRIQKTNKMKKEQEKIKKILLNTARELKKV